MINSYYSNYRPLDLQELLLVFATVIIPEFQGEPIEMTKLRREVEASICTVETLEGGILDSKIYIFIKLFKRFRNE
jgi:hypothetical protein